MDERGAQTFTVSRFTGLPSFQMEDRLESQILSEAEADPGSTFLRDRPSPTTFHVANRGRQPVAAAVSTVGHLSEVPLGLALAAAGVDITDLQPVPSPVSELVSMSEDRAVTVNGVTEALYRSFYQQSKIQGARSLVVGIDPWVLDLLNEQYGLPFKVIGPMLELLGRTLLPVGGRLAELEAGIAVNSPRFFEFMQQDDSASARP